MIITYEKEFNKLKKELEDYNCTVHPIKELLSPENKLFLEVLIKTPTNNLFLYMNKSYICINSSVKYRIKDTYSYVFLNKLEKLESLDRYSLDTIELNNIIELLTEDNCSYSIDIENKKETFIKVLKKHCINFNKISYSKDIKGKDILNIYLDNCIISYKIIEKGNKYDYKFVFLFTDRKEATLYENERDFSEIVIGYLSQGMLVKNILYENKVKFEEAFNVKNEEPSYLADIKLLNEKMSKFIIFNSLNKVDISNLENYVKNKEIEIKEKKEDFNAIKDLYDKLEKKMDKEFKLIVDENLKKMKMLYNNELNEYNRLAIEYIKYQQKKIYDIANHNIDIFLENN